MPNALQQRCLCACDPRKVPTGATSGTSAAKQPPTCTEERVLGSRFQRRAAAGRLVKKAAAYRALSARARHAVNAALFSAFQLVKVRGITPAPYQPFASQTANGAGLDEGLQDFADLCSQTSGVTTDSENDEGSDEQQAPSDVSSLSKVRDFWRRVTKGCWHGMRYPRAADSALH